MVSRVQFSCCIYSDVWYHAESGVGKSFFLLPSFSFLEQCARKTLVLAAARQCKVCMGHLKTQKSHRFLASHSIASIALFVQSNGVSGAGCELRGGASGAANSENKTGFERLEVQLHDKQCILLLLCRP